MAGRNATEGQTERSTKEVKDPALESTAGDYCQRDVSREKELDNNTLVDGWACS